MFKGGGERNCCSTSRTLPCQRELCCCTFRRVCPAGLPRARCAALGNACLTTATLFSYPCTNAVSHSHISRLHFAKRDITHHTVDGHGTRASPFQPPAFSHFQPPPHFHSYAGAGAAMSLHDLTFRDVEHLLPRDTLVVLNHSRVITARLHMAKQDTGGAVEVPPL